MATIIPNVGLDWVANNSVPSKEVPELQYVAVGTGTTAPAVDDTALESEIYRSDIANSNASITKSSSTGTVRVSITVSGGTEVPAGSDITELGVFTESDDLIYREVRNTITIKNGERITFEFTIGFAN